MPCDQKSLEMSKKNLGLNKYELISKSVDFPECAIELDGTKWLNHSQNM